jgi:anhydro-N-acetylmuramic acid kinase
MKKSLTIGLMSGTSLDGLDIAACSFSDENNIERYQVTCCESISYSDDFRSRLRDSHLLNAEQLVRLHIEFAEFCATSVTSFIRKHKLQNILLISSHGHTVFHKPENGYTLQIGDGSVIAKRTGIPVVCDFRAGDVALGGQGAPLVPIGDELLFGEYDACLNLGGFSNISMRINDKRIAYDICPVNIILNIFAREKGLEYDNNGNLAHSGKIIQNLYNDLNKIEYYSLPFPKSLSREWLEECFIPLVDKYRMSSKTEDIMHTIVKHIAFQLGQSLENIRNVMISGGGCFNSFLIDSLKDYTNCEIIIPDDNTVNYKEALIFAFLGYLRWNNKVNCLASVTGAKRDSCGGAVYLV